MKALDTVRSFLLRLDDAVLLESFLFQASGVFLQGRRQNCVLVRRLHIVILPGSVVKCLSNPPHTPHHVYGAGISRTPNLT